MTPSGTPGRVVVAVGWRVFRWRLAEACVPARLEGWRRQRWRAGYALSRPRFRRQMDGRARAAQAMLASYAEALRTSMPAEFEVE